MRWNILGLQERFKQAKNFFIHRLVCGTLKGFTFEPVHEARVFIINYLGNVVPQSTFSTRNVRSTLQGGAS